MNFQHLTDHDECLNSILLSVKPEPAELRLIRGRGQSQEKEKYQEDTTPEPLRVYDASLICQRTYTQQNYLVDKLIPVGPVDVFGPPAVSKSTIIGTLISAIANNDGTWMGRKCASGRVCMIGGEKADEDVWKRDFTRLKVHYPDPDRFLIINPRMFLFEYDRIKESWNYSHECRHQILPLLKCFAPTLVVIDTLSRYAKGSDPGNITQQVELGVAIERAQRDFNAGTLVTISHTPQHVSNLSLSSRLDYMSRSGGNGLPGILRNMLALTELKSDERESAGILPERNRVIALAAAKHSETAAPQPNGSKVNPILFELKLDGSVAVLQQQDAGRWATEGKDNSRKSNEGEVAEKAAAAENSTKDMRFIKSQEAVDSRKKNSANEIGAETKQEKQGNIFDPAKIASVFEK